MKLETVSIPTEIEAAESPASRERLPLVNPLLRLFPSLSDVAFLMPIGLALVLRHGVSGMIEGDTGWHIRTGQWILENGRVPRQDIFSFTMPGQPWFAWEWLWDLIFGWLHLHWGLGAVVLGSLLALCCVSLLIFRIALRRCENRILALGVTMLAMAASAVHWWARPHLFTLLFLAVFYFILDRTRADRGRLLWLLPVLTILWTNLHAGFFVGIGLICSYAAGDLIHAAVTPEKSERAAGFSRAARYILIAALCAIASLANPYGYHLHGHIVSYLNDTWLWQHIAEFQSLSFHGTTGKYFEFLLVSAVAASVWSALRRRYGQALLVAACSHMALMAGRNIPLLAVVAAPVIAQAAEECIVMLRTARCAGWLRRSLETLDEIALEFGAVDRAPRLHLVSAAAVLFVVFLFYKPAAAALTADFAHDRFPVQGVHFLEKQRFTEKVFTGDQWGDYLIYRLYPHGRVFVDGRSDFYGARLDDAFLDIIGGRYTWQRQLDEYRIETVLLPVQANLAGVLKESSRWKPVYDDGVAIVFRRSAVSGTPDSHTSSGGVTLAGRVHGRAVGAHQTTWFSNHEIK